MYNEALSEELSRLLKARCRTNFALAKTNFEIGRIVYQTMEKDGEEGVRKLASFYPGKSLALERFLFDSCRVYRSIKNPSFLFAMREKLGGNLSWGFLLNRCTREPTGNSEEAALYWENRLKEIESGAEKVERLIEKYEEIPDSVKPQVDGVLAALGYAGAYLSSGEDAPASVHVGLPDSSGKRPGRKVLHIGDEHFDSGDLLEEIIKSGKYIAERAREIEPDLIVSSGDMLDTRQSHDSPALRAAIDFVKELAGIAPVFILKGTTTHDGVSVSFFEALETKHRVYVSETLGMVGLRAGEFFPLDEYREGLDAVIYSVPPATKANIIANGEGMRDANGTVADMLRSVFTVWGSYSDMAGKDGVMTIVSGHGTVTGSQTSTGQKMVGRDIEFGIGDLLLIGADVVCLSHIHKAQSWDAEGIFYSGSIARLNVGETEEKGFWVHTKTFEGRRSEFIVIPTKDIISRDFDGVPSIENLPEIKEGSLVRICYKVAEEDIHTVDEEALREHILSLGAAEVRIEKAVIPKQMVRAAGISKLTSLEDKLRKWGETTMTEITGSLLQKLALLELPRDVLFMELNLPIPQRRMKR